MVAKSSLRLRVPGPGSIPMELHIQGQGRAGDRRLTLGARHYNEVTLPVLSRVPED